MSARKPVLNGKAGSNKSTTLLKKSKRDVQLERLLAAVYKRIQKMDDPVFDAQCKQDFVFHMMDWKNDFRKLVTLYAHPERFTPKSAEAIIAGFLWHAPWHLRAAARLLLDITPEDVFLELETKVRKPSKADQDTNGKKKEIK